MDCWSPSPRPTRFSEDTSSTDECMRTPEGELQGPLPSPAESTPRVLQIGIETSASRDLQRKGRISKMKRTPQPTLTQSKLTSILQVLPKPGGEVPGTLAEAPARRLVPLESVEMDTSCAPAAQAPGAAAGPPNGGTTVTTDFLLKAFKDNMDHLKKSFNLSLGALSHQIDGNVANITANAAAISQQSATTAEQGSHLQRLTERVTALEKGSSGLVAAPLESRGALSPEYLLARRSIRLWPIEGMSEDDL